MSSTTLFFQGSQIGQSVAWVLEALRVVGSLGLSGLLALLYWRMYREQQSQNEVQRTQSDIMDRQTKLMAASFKPDITVESVSAAGDTIEIVVKNAGRGRAKNFRVCCQPYLAAVEEGYQPAWEFIDPELRPVVVPLSRTDESGSDEREPYRGTIEIEQSAGGQSRRPFRDCVREVSARNWNGRIAVELYLVYDSELGDRFVKRFACLNDFEIESACTIERAMETSATDDPILDTLN
ncbi:hypothetical protein SAMN05216559_0845 [Halomicrobium zhouii]|uniref:Uncharacterized protein n=2 Tax=Halomicrobium zhouii TaxID=767519 RepID=A0A1I6KII4_9EURY|nr:hypothetical protein SAMN05216559_0845 [Halomicrobium zhouii]